MTKDESLPGAESVKNTELQWGGSIILFWLRLFPRSAFQNGVEKQSI